MKMHKITITIGEKHDEEAKFGSIYVGCFAQDLAEELRVITNANLSNSITMAHAILNEVEYYLNHSQPDQNQTMNQITDFLSSIEKNEEGLKFMLDVLRFARVTSPNNLEDHGIKPKSDYDK